MNKITHSVISRLDHYRGEPVLTMYIPTHRGATPPNMREDQTRFKNLVKQGCEEWKRVGEESKIDIITEQLLTTLDNLAFWQATTESLAVFATYDNIEIYHLPVECEESVSVSDSFDTASLHIINEMNQGYYVLALAMHNTRLFYGDMYELQPVELDFPTSPEDALNIDEMFSGSQTVRGVATRNGGNETLSSHGQGDSNHAGQEERLKYFRIIDSLLLKSIKHDTATPILLAATESEASDYRSISNLSHLLEVYLPGNHTSDTTAELHEQTRQLIDEEVIGSRMKQSMKRIEYLRGALKSSTDAQEIAEAAMTGRVEELYVNALDMTADSVSDTSGRRMVVRRDAKRQAGRLKTTIRNVIEQGGRVVGLTQSNTQGNSSVAAIYRY